MVNEKSSMIKKKSFGETSASSGVRSLPCIYHLINLLLFNGGTVITLPCSTTI